MPDAAPVGDTRHRTAPFPIRWDYRRNDATLQANTIIRGDATDGPLFTHTSRFNRAHARLSLCQPRDRNTSRRATSL